MHWQEPQPPIPLMMDVVRDEESGHEFVIGAVGARVSEAVKDALGSLGRRFVRVNELARGKRF